jgi:riboflavin kinase/FMN adenylyltransferase
MKIIRLPESETGAVMALGNFDGVHNGHREILRQTMEKAKALKAPAAVLTFDPHPRRFFAPYTTPFQLTTLEEKTVFLEGLGLDYLFIADFDKNLEALSAKAFVETILVERLKVRHVVVGTSFAFGHGREGTPDTLREFKKYFGVTEVPPVLGPDEHIYSSTRARFGLERGNLDLVRQVLGRDFDMGGPVIEGEKRGRMLGFPTANVTLIDRMCPRFGVYVALARIEDENVWHPAVVNIGVKPTFRHMEPLLEAHLFHFDRNVYGKKITVRLKEYLREERKFPRVEELTEQICKDCAAALDYIEKQDVTT